MFHKKDIEQIQAQIKSVNRRLDEIDKRSSGNRFKISDLEDKQSIRLPDINAFMFESKHGIGDVLEALLKHFKLTVEKISPEPSKVIVKEKE